MRLQIYKRSNKAFCSVLFCSVLFFGSIFFMFLVRRQLLFVALYVQLHRLPLLSLLLKFRCKTCSESYYHNMHSGSFPAVARRRSGGLRCSSGCCLLCDWRVRRPRGCLRACVGGQWTVYACAPVPSALRLYILRILHLLLSFHL